MAFVDNTQLGCSSRFWSNTIDKDVVRSICEALLGVCGKEGVGPYSHYMDTLPHIDVSRKHMHVLETWRELVVEADGLVSRPSRSCIPPYNLDSNATGRTQPHLNAHRGSLPVGIDESHKKDLFQR